MVGGRVPRSLLQARAICVRIAVPPKNQIASLLLEHHGVLLAHGRCTAESKPKSRSDQLGEGENVCIEQIIIVIRVELAWQVYGCLANARYSHADAEFSVFLT